MVRKGRSPALLGVGCLSIKQHLLIPAFLLFPTPSSFMSFSFSCQYFSFWILELLVTTVSTITALLVFLFFLSWMTSDHGLSHTLATIFSVKFSQGHTAVLNQTGLWVTDSWSSGLKAGRWQCVHLAHKQRNAHKLCALLWTQKTGMFLFVFSNALCLDVKAARKNKTKPKNKHHFS